MQLLKKWSAIPMLVILFNSARLVRTGEELTLEDGSGADGDN